MSRRESFVHRSLGLLPLRAIFDFPRPHCRECKLPMVRFRARWACKDCTKVDLIRQVAGWSPTVDGMQFMPQVEVAKVPLGEAYPNRAARRRA